MEPISEGQSGFKRSRDNSSRRTGRRNRDEEAPPVKSKRTGAKRQGRDNLRRELLPAGIAVSVGLAFLLPILILPELFALTWLVAFAISIFGFVKGCLRATREGSFVAFDYLESLGPLRWFLAVGFFGLYLCGYLAFWTFAQIRCAFDKPKAFLPWFGVQAFGVILVFLAIFTAAISNQVWKTVRPGNPPGPGAFGPGSAGAQGQKKEPEWEPEPPAVTGDRDTDRLLARAGGKNAETVRAAAEQLAGMQPTRHRSVVARKLADAVKTTEAGNRPVLIRALGAWATVEEAPVLIRFLSEGDPNTRNESLKAVSKMLDERAVEPAIRCLESAHTAYQAEQALKKMGPFAEKGLLAALNQPSYKDTWIPILRILKETGTEKSIPTLEAASRGDFAYKGSAQDALDTVRRRTGK